VTAGLQSRQRAITCKIRENENRIFETLMLSKPDIFIRVAFSSLFFVFAAAKERKR